MLAAGWEWEHIPAVPIVAVRVAVAAGAEAAAPTAAVLQEEHFEVLGSVPTAAVQAAAAVAAAGAVVPTAAGQAGVRGTGKAEEAGSTAAARLAQAATEQQLVPEQPVPEQPAQGPRPLQPLALLRGALPARVQLSVVRKAPIGSVFELQAGKPQNDGPVKGPTSVPEECALQVLGSVSAV